MRTLLSVSSLAALLAFVGSAEGAHASLTLSPSTYKVLYGHTLMLSGRLVDGATRRPVTIEAWQFGSPTARVIATVQTHFRGVWSVRVRPSVQTIYRARVATTFSPKVTIGVRPLVVARQLGNGHVWTRVSGGRSFAGRYVQLQRLSAGAWRTVGKKRLSSASIAVFARPLPLSLLRAALSVNEAGAGYLGSASHDLVYRPYRVTLAPSSYKVLFGQTTTLSGRLVHGNRGARIVIFALPFGRTVAHRVATVQTHANGFWSYRARPTIQTSYQAVWATQASQRVTVGVRPLLTLRELANGRLVAHVSAGRSFGRRALQLQRLNGKTWKTVVKRRLDRDSTAVFSVRLGARTTVRAALSVNQAGAGYLGTTSHSLSYRPV